MGRKAYKLESEAKMTRITFSVDWSGEFAAGILPGSEEVSIEFKYGHPVTEDLIEFWIDSLAEFYDGAAVKVIHIEDAAQ